MKEAWQGGGKCGKKMRSVDSIQEGNTVSCLSLCNMPSPSRSCIQYALPFKVVCTCPPLQGRVHMPSPSRSCMQYAPPFKVGSVQCTLGVHACMVRIHIRCARWPSMILDLQTRDYACVPMAWLGVPTSWYTSWLGVPSSWYTCIHVHACV